MEENKNQSAPTKSKAPVSLQVSRNIIVKVKPIGTAFAKRNPDAINFTKQVVGGSINGKKCMTVAELEHYFPPILSLSLLIFVSPGRCIFVASAVNSYPWGGLCKL